eukprot:g3788.t1 g3788   contig13:161618-164492(+)
MEMQFRDEMYKAIVAEGNKCDIDFSNRINFGDCIDASMDSLCTLNYATLKEIKRPKEGRGKYNLINGHSSGCPRMMEVSVGKRFQSLKFEEAKKEGEKARSDFRLENLRFNDGIVIAFDKPKKYGTTLQTIQRNLGLKSVDYLHAISVLLRIFHALLHWEVNKKPLNSLCCSAEIFVAQFGEGKENGFDGKLVSLKGQCRHPEWMMRGFAAGCTNAELEPFDRALCTFLAYSKEMREELKSRGVDLDEFNEPVSINLSFSDLDGLSEEERACYLLNRQEGSRLGGQRCGLLHRIASKVASSVLESASLFEDLHLSDDLFDDAVMLCDVVHEGSVKTTLSVLQSLRKGHGLFSLMKTIAKNNTLSDITNATSLFGLKMSKEDRALLHQHGETKSIASVLAIKGGDRMKTIAKNNTLSDITNATSLGDLKMSEEDRALLHQHGETKSIASVLAIKGGDRMKTIAKNNTLTDITNATSLGDLKMSEEDRALLHQHGETKSIASLLAIKGGDRMKTIAKNNTLSDITNATSLGDLKMSEEDRALLHQHGETKSIASLFAIKRGHRMKTIAKNNTLSDITNATSLGGLKMSEEDRALLHQHGETKSIASLFAIKRGHKDRMASEGVTVDGKSKKSLTMIRSRETKRQKELETLGSKRLFCGYCGETKFFKEGSRAPAFQSLSEAIHHSNSNSPLDGVIISTPTPTHERLITEAANNNINIFTEKPVDETSAKIRKLFNAVRAQNVHLCCGFQRRFDDSYLSLYNTIHSGGIGTPLNASIFFGDHPVPSRQFLLQGGGNIISDCSAHDVDYIRWVLGDEVESVFAMGTSSDEELRDKNVIDNATMVMKFLKGEKCTGLSLENKDLPILSILQNADITQDSSISHTFYLIAIRLNSVMRDVHFQLAPLKS